MMANGRENKRQAPYGLPEAKSSVPEKKMAFWGRLGPGRTKFGQSAPKSCRTKIGRLPEFGT